MEGGEKGEDNLDMGKREQDEEGEKEEDEEAEEDRQATPRTRGFPSTGQQFNVGLVAIAPVLFLPGHLRRNTQALQHLDCRGRGGEAGVELLAHAFDGEARHHRQHLEQPVAGRACSCRLQKASAVGGH